MTTKTAPAIAQTLQDIRPLTNNEYDKARDEAIKRIKKRAGEKPTRQQFERDYGPLWSMIDMLAALVGLSALLISSAHILNHAGHLAAESHAATVEAVNIAGFTISQTFYGAIHQIGFIVLAESAMILFMVMHTNRPRRARADDENAILHALRGASIPLLLALVSALFVFVANWQSGIGILEAILPPAVTIGLGIYFESRIAESLRRREEVTAKYLSAVDDYEAAQKDPTTASDYPILMRQAIAHAVQYKRANRDTEIPVGLLKLAVVRELERERWAAEWDDQQLVRQYRAIKRGDDTALNPTGAAMTAAPIPTTTAAAPNGNGTH